MSSAAAASINNFSLDAFLDSRPFLQSSMEEFRSLMMTIPSGGVAGEEEYEMWGKEFVGQLVSAFCFVFRGTDGNFAGEP
jgi:hypothetical protein